MFPTFLDAHSVCSNFLYGHERVPPHSKNNPMTHLRTICLCACSYLDLDEGMCWDKHLKIYRNECVVETTWSIFFASLSAKPPNGATPSYSSVQVTWIQKYGDVIYVFGDADLGPCKVTNLVAGSLLWFSCHMWQIRGLPKKPNPKKGWLIGNYIQEKCII